MRPTLPHLTMLRHLKVLGLQALKNCLHSTLTGASSVSTVTRASAERRTEGWLAPLQIPLSLSHNKVTPLVSLILYVPLPIIHVPLLILFFHHHHHHHRCRHLQSPPLARVTLSSALLATALSPPTLFGSAKSKGSGAKTVIFESTHPYR